MQDTPIKYALDITTGNPVFIEDAKNGRECNCKCAECGKQMDAIQGEIREKHFRHVIETDCKGGHETILHLRAKQIIVENNQIAIPGEILIYSNPRKEEPFSNIQPDVTVVVNEKFVFFEVAVTNPKKTPQLEFYKNGKHPCIEIDLKGVPYDLPINELKKLVLEDVNNKKIIFWPGKTNENFSQWQNLKSFLFAVLFISIIVRLIKFLNDTITGKQRQRQIPRRLYIKSRT